MTETVPHIDYDSLQLGDELGRGRHGRVFAVYGYPVEGQWTGVLKLYWPDFEPWINVPALEAIAGFPATLDANDSRWLENTAAWPAVIVEKRGAVCGFLMRKVPQEYYFDRPSRTQPTVLTPAAVDLLFKPDLSISRLGLTVTDRDRFALLQDLAYTLWRLHSKGVVVGDLSSTNVLFRLAPKPGCFLIGCDAMRVGDASVLQQLQAPGWEVPPGERTATQAADTYKFALLAIRLFAGDPSTRDPDSLARLAPMLGPLAEHSLNRHPSRRASWAEWTPALAAAGGSVKPPPAPTRASPSAPPRAPRTPPPVDSSPPPSRRTAVMVFGSAAIVIAAVIILLILTLPSGRPGTASPPAKSPSAISPSPGSAGTPGGGTAPAQAKQINNLLDASAGTRAPLATALADASGCHDISGAVATITAVAGRYGTEYGQATRLKTGQLPNGAALKNNLMNAYYVSAEANYELAAWAKEKQASRCAGSAQATHYYNAGMADTAKATKAKEKFVQLWNPVAASQGFPARSAADI